MGVKSLNNYIQNIFFKSFKNLAHWPYLCRPN